MRVTARDPRTPTRETGERAILGTPLVFSFRGFAMESRVPKFDPRSPLPGRAAFEMRATAVGQASPTRLRVACAAGLLLAAAMLLVPRWWWMGAWPLMLASFGAWGLAMQGTLQLDVDGIEAPRLRLLYRVIRGVSVVVGAASLLVGLVTLLAAGMGMTASAG
jgi:hypothetical protein